MERAPRLACHATRDGVIGTKAGRDGGTGVLMLLALAQFLMTVDASVMNVSIGALVEDLDTTVTAIQGVITAYTLVMACGMITGPRSAT